MYIYFLHTFHEQQMGYCHWSEACKNQDGENTDELS